MKNKLVKPMAAAGLFTQEEKAGEDIPDEATVAGAEHEGRDRGRGKISMEFG